MDQAPARPLQCELRAPAPEARRNNNTLLLVPNKNDIHTPDPSQHHATWETGFPTTVNHAIAFIWITQGS